MERDQIIERTGADNWKMVIEWFGEMTPEEILESCNDIWPTETEANTELAEAIAEALN